MRGYTPCRIERYIEISLSRGGPGSLASPDLDEANSELEPTIILETAILPQLEVQGLLGSGPSPGGSRIPNRPHLVAKALAHLSSPTYDMNASPAP